MIANYATAVTSGTAITFSLFYLMQSLIAMQPGVIVEERLPVPMPWLLDKRKDDPPVVDDFEVEIDDVVPPPKTEPVVAEHETQVPISVPAVVHRPSGSGDRTIDYGLSDGPLVNVIRVLPNYPIRATMDGREGYVIVQFDVLASGQVGNVSVLESSHSVFDKEAVKAALRFRYKARIVDGVAVESYGVRYLFTFKLEQS